MFTNLTFNQLVVPLGMMATLALVLLAVLVNLRAASRKQSQQKRLNELKPPKKGRNHKSLPNRQYYLTRGMAKPTPEEEHLLEKYLKLHPEEAKGPIKA